MGISIVHTFHPLLQCSLKNSNVFEIPLRPTFIFLRYEEPKIEKTFFIFRLLMKLIKNESDSYLASTKGLLSKKIKNLKEDEKVGRSAASVTEKQLSKAGRFF